MSDLIDFVKFNEQGLVASVAQDYQTKKVLMLAWMSRESILKTLEVGSVFYYSRSRKCLWHKGETSGQYQIVKDIFLDCDGDSILLIVEQKKGIACHTGKPSCFFRRREGVVWNEN